MVEDGPVRSCIGCGRKAPKGELRRLGLVGGQDGKDGEVVVDRRQRLPGRGAYLCGSGCLAAAVKRKALQRAFKGKAGPLASESLERLEVALRES